MAKFKHLNKLKKKKNCHLYKMCESAQLSLSVDLLKMRFPEEWEFCERVPFAYKVCKRIYQKLEKFLNCFTLFFTFRL